MPPLQPPPARYDGTPRAYLLPAGSTLTRLHSERYGVTEFNPTVARRARTGGRFDASPGDEYAFLYAASDDPTAVSEALLRGVPSDERGSRVLPEVQLRGLRIGWLRTTRDLEFVSLRSGVDLAAVGQDTWLTSAPLSEYPMTRRWAAAIREWAPDAHGLTWRSYREPAGFAYILFADRCPAGSIEEAVDGMLLPPADRNLDDGLGWAYLEELLATYRIVLE